MKNFKALVSVLALGVLSTACGNMVPTEKTGTIVSSSTGVSGTSLAQACSLSPNVSSLTDPGALASQYRSCQNAGTAGSIQLFKEDATVSAICIFPAKVINGSISLYVSNPYAPVTSRYVAQCTTTRNPGIIVNFSGLDFNALYIVNQGDAANMATCIDSGSVSSCAAFMGFQFSYGQFK